jgi:catechol 2,3-dioxygenase-like lactoylglutathione lyase family enzyme
MSPEKGKQPMIQYKGINHLAMITSDMDSTIRFWRDLLGMRLVAGIGKPGYRHYFFEISENNLLAFFEWTGAEPVSEKDAGRPVKGPLVFDHVSFELQGEEDLWNLKARLEAAGFWVSEVIDHGFIHSIFSFDPNGIAIEFSLPVASVNIRKHPVMVEAAPSAATAEGPLPQPGKWPETGQPTPLEERRAYPGELQKMMNYGKSIW